MKYYYTIGEVSNLLGVKPHVIRYWESEFSMLRPRRDGGRNRRYTQDNILMLKKIQDMLHNQRYTIAGARAKLKADAKAKEPLRQQLFSATELRSEMLELRGKMEQIISLCEAINKEDK
ncbi:MAG TPA: MerR family transcriptional regulator [Candidatus Cloacimonadota bacterium]|nr:MerR family transcriptional regulator [Candidatus Cloacimonadota bacterium]